MFYLIGASNRSRAMPRANQFFSKVKFLKVIGNIFKYYS